ncbi:MULTISPECIES: LrgB family protein [unclassified Granulicatella]|uniref:LrgB family protein n=1 Tax=unclassified Granulicatella TaxID=2630493 RepID=UPI00142F5849|nr:MULTISPECIES: LrgB family protein [unclassified Granulicatella]MBF0781042.1 LrgB family protein [Granulicatella sp. 19428wC4_WM01]
MTNSHLIGFILCVVTYSIGLLVQEKTKWTICNPFLLSMSLILFVMLTTGYSFEQFNKGAMYIAFFLLPATCGLSLNIYRQKHILKAYFIPSVLGCVVGSIASMSVTYLLCMLLDIEHTIKLSTLPRSITSAVAADVSTQIGGIPSITLLCVVLSGMFGAMFIPLLTKYMKNVNSVALGIGIGSSAHVLGTAKAIELGEIEGAMSSIAISISGLITVVLATFIS